MSLSFPIKYSGLVKGKYLGVPGWVNFHNRTAKIKGSKPGPGGYGAVSLHYVSAVTVTNTTDGTPLTNGVSSAVVNGTYVDPNAPLVLTGDEIKSMYTDPDYLMEVTDACGNGLYLAVQNQLIADLIAGTPLSTETLPGGSANFEVVSSNEAVLLGIMAKRVTYMMAYFGAAPTDLAICMCAFAWANFVALRATGINNPVQMPDGSYSFMGVPIYVIPGAGASPGEAITGGATNFGAASQPCAFVTHRDSLLVAVEEPYIHGGGPIAASDGTTKWITKMPYAHALVNNHFAEVLNSTS